MLSHFLSYPHLLNANPFVSFHTVIITVPPNIITLPVNIIKTRYSSLKIVYGQTLSFCTTHFL